MDAQEQRACEVADVSSDELEQALLKLAATTQSSDAERDSQLQALDDALSEMRSNVQADTEALASDIAAVCADLAENTSNDNETIAAIQRNLGSLEARFDASLHNEMDDMKDAIQEGIDLARQMQSPTQRGAGAGGAGR